MTLPQLPTSKPIVAAAGPLGTGTAAWAASWSSANGLLNPYQAVVRSALSASSAAPAADATQVTAVWSDGPLGTTLADFGVLGYSPPTGQGPTLLAAIDAALLAAAVVYGTAVLQDADGSLRQALAAAWIVWTVNGGSALPGGAGGELQTLTLGLG